ncbi:EpsI family protein [Desulfoprunum benzoelyticum]|uniref:EpsI family protein n=1 Tax=Desulfoprunum benzoelyticum TaxID=1506996 RepID=A0A840UMW3_9BACT|nr:exosortase C-terminal domain/associated protein EpsI [Desulfoprunum benzoelyticum]MBB5346965.1 EpsI family protein [Desulfoprunum benzoelyticum]MBM9531017.1 EpsI family protein [Desulfoprunum benzoelyticum]
MDNKISTVRIVVVFAMFALTWYFLHSTAAVVPVAIKKPLASFPHVIGEYRLGNSFQSSADVIELLGVDDYIQYNYVSAAGERINLYVGYYQAVGVHGGYHSPKNCIPGGGWGIDKVKTVELEKGIEGRSRATVSEMVIRNGAEYQVVLYWYQNRGRIIASEYWEKIYQVLDALLMRRRDGTFVRIMAYAPNGDIAAAEAKVKKFAEHVIPLLEHHLPGARI